MRFLGRICKNPHAADFWCQNKCVLAFHEPLIDFLLGFETNVSNPNRKVLRNMPQKPCTPTNHKYYQTTLAVVFLICSSGIKISICYKQ